MSWWKTAKPGDKVVCVDEGLHLEHDIYPNPVFGVVYTISNVFVCEDGCPMIELVEIPTTWDNEEFYAGFQASHFAPVQARSTEAGMTTLRNLLNTKPHDKLVEA